MKTTFSLILCAVLLLGQAVTPPPSNIHQLFYSGGNLQYDCQAPAQVGPTSVQTSDLSLTSIAVSSNTGTVTTLASNGAWPGMKVIVSGSATTALNATYTVATVTSSTVYTITTSSVSNGTYSDTTLVVTTNAPLLTSSVWSITVLHYTTGVLDGVYLGGPGASVAYKAICANRANY